MIGRGALGGQIQITPASANNKNNITDANIQSELAAQIDGGHLPQPDANTLYSTFFRHGQTICDGTGSCSLRAGGFCAYHSTFVHNGREIYYTVSRT